MKITRGNQSHPLPLLTTRYPYTLLTMPIIEVNHVTKEYQLGQLQSLKTTALSQWRRLTGQPVEERTPFKALDNVNFSAEQGEVLGISDTSGAGKSTLLRCSPESAFTSQGAAG